MPDVIGFCKELQALAADMVDTDGETMKHWDQIRGQVERLKGSDLPRLNFEGLMETLSDKIREAAELLGITETGYQQICLKNDALQALVGKMTDAMLASEQGKGRLREALQRLLDWNEGIAAGRGNHYPREHADVARAALQSDQAQA